MYYILLYHASQWPPFLLMLGENLPQSRLCHLKNNFNICIHYVTVDLIGMKTKMSIRRLHERKVFIMFKYRSWENELLFAKVISLQPFLPESDTAVETPWKTGAGFGQRLICHWTEGSFWLNVLTGRFLGLTPKNCFWTVEFKVR